MTAVSRRRFLTTSVAGAGAVAAGAAGFTLGSRQDAAATLPSAGIEPFFGPHQAGIATAQQDRLLFAAYDLTTTDATAVQSLLQHWTDAAARLTQGNLVGQDDANRAAPPAGRRGGTLGGQEDATRAAPPVDTGEAMGLDPAHLTVTFGFGAGLFE